MDFAIPPDIRAKLDELDLFIEREITPLEREHIQFFDHRREHARTDWDHDGQPRREWEDLLAEMRRRADRAGHLRFALPREIGGQDGSNLAMAIIREHLAHKGLGLHNDLQNESSIVGNFPVAHLMWVYGTAEQKAHYLEGMITGEHRIAFGLTEPEHGSDATWMETTARRQGDDWVINGAKRFNTGMHTATLDLVFARTSGEPGDGRGITAFLVPTGAPGFTVEFMWWTFNMPSDHAEVTLKDVRVPHEAILGREGEGLVLAQHFVHENRIRQAASSVGAAQYCIDESIAYARKRKTWGKPLGREPGHPVPARRAVDGGGDDPDARVQDGVASRSPGPHEGEPHGLDGELPGESPRVPGRRPRDPGPRRHRLHAPQALRAHLSPSSPLSHHRRLGGDPDPARGLPALRVHGPDAVVTETPRFTRRAIWCLTWRRDHRCSCTLNCVP